MNMNMGETTTTTYIIVDLGIKLDKGAFGSLDRWSDINQQLDEMGEQLGIREVSSGTGFGVRDMQFRANSQDWTEETLRNKVTTFIEQSNMIPEYVCIYYADEDEE